MSIGKLEAFRVGESNWSSYVTWICQYFKVNKVEENLKTAILITVVGDEAFELMVDLCSPVLPEEMAFGDLIKLWKIIYNPDHLK